MKTPSRLSLAILFAAGTWQLGAQTVAPTSPRSETAAEKRGAQTLTTKDLKTNKDADTASDNDAIVLSPFEVTAEKDTGYAATETLAGTRIRTDLKDVGAAIGVVTKEFLQDVGATDAGTLLQYTTNAEVAGSYGTYAGLGNGTSVDESSNLRAPAGAQRVRGLAAADNARDFYVTDIPWDSFNTDRVDILRGPNSILFGLGSPAGIVNNATRNAEFRNKGSVDFRLDQWGSYRNSLDINQQLIKNVLAIRLDGLFDDQKYEQKQAFQNQKRVYGTLRFDPQLFKDRTWRTSVKVRYEHGDIAANRPRTITPNDNVSAWYRSSTVSASNPYGGMGMTSVNNPYDIYRTDGVVAGNGYGMIQAGTTNYQPYLADVIGNVQQPFWQIDGTTNQLYQAYGGYINNGARDSNGNFNGVSNGMVGLRQNAALFGVASLPTAAANYKLPGYLAGQYKNVSMTDPTIFDFYKNLIDGPNTKKEWENWDAYNIDLSQTAYDDRLGVDFSYDRQKYKNGSESLLGGNPTINIDLTKNLSDYYVSGANGETSVTNSGYGRPFVSSYGGGSGRSYYSDREYERGSLFAELRPSDLTKNDWLLKIFGKQRLNGVASDEKYFNENRTWQMEANSQAWDGYWNGNAGNNNNFTNRSPVGIVYLGSSVVNRTSASGASIPAISAPVTLQDSNVRVFDTTWQNYATSFSGAYTPAAGLSQVYNTNNTLYQNSNPANYTGWNSNFVDNLVRYNDGQNLSLLTLAQKSMRETLSYSGSYQGYFWNNALVATLGWRYDEVKTKDVTAQAVTNNRGSLDMSPNDYKLPDEFPSAQIVKGHSTSGGAVLHLNNILKHDPLPINVSLSYNESSNFQVTSIRRDIYGTPIGNPAGKTYEYGALLSTKDGKFSLRVVKYDTRVKNAAAALNNPSGLGGVIVQGLKWRNVFLYQLGGYTWDTRNQPSYRNTWTNAYPNETAAQAQAEEDAAITGWNNIQKYLEGKGFFKAWNFNPTTSSALTDRTTYVNNPSAYTPDSTTLASYTTTAPQGFTVTSDAESKGNEFELTANPLSNWRISFNASETTAVRTNVGGGTLDELISYLNTQLGTPATGQTPAGMVPQYGSAGASIYLSNYAPWLANYNLLKLQQGTAAPEIRKWRYNIISNYTFTHGMLKNVGVGGGYRWQDKVILGYPYQNSTVTYDLTKPIYGPTESAIDFWVSYEHKITSKVNWKIQINVRNAFAKDGLIPISVEPDGSYASVRTKPTQEWLCTNSFSF